MRRRPVASPTKGAAMPRLTPIDPATATGEAKELLDGIQAAFGMTPNSFRAMANNPGVLKGWTELSGALGTTIARNLGEQIAIAIAEQNGCAYCLSAHTAVAGLRAIDAHEIDRNRSGESDDERAAAALRFALTVNAKRGGVSDNDLAEVRAAGYDAPTSRRSSRTSRLTFSPTTSTALRSR